MFSDAIFELWLSRVENGDEHNDTIMITWNDKHNYCMTMIIIIKKTKIYNRNNCERQSDLPFGSWCFDELKFFIKWKSGLKLHQQ